MSVLRSLTARLLAASLLGLGLLFANGVESSPARAMSVSPVYLDMVSAGPRSRADIRVVNRGDRPLPIEAVVSRVIRDAEGNQIVKRNDTDFLVLPMQAMIPPGGSQVLKVQWLGDPMIAESRAYRISVNQLPVAEPSGQTSVQILMNLAVIVHVAPPEGAPALELVRHGTASGRNGARIPTVTVRNPSNVHARLPDATLRLRGGGWRKVLPPQTLDALLGIGTVMPGQTRTFQLPVPLPDDVQSLQAQLDYQPPSRR
ncbi:fimbrial biogenesis chaperone [Dichotomicrobium thermohalophilum]|uniref:Fimbrial chaperone protein n=1 Tax=Dichotomicrobium thermohalophilum TaxID=933063 RepID=A0A397QDL2_9HYPH|nr:fimbria/pilus periplasmic chaperone [Dichotomicrobium thermohalophilum]RIA56341.1 fimbrial chaperone protein [Dichotomicrobium thermohalophilum]